MIVMIDDDDDNKFMRKANSWLMMEFCSYKR